MVLRRQLLTSTVARGILAVALLGVTAGCRSYTDTPPGPGDVAPLPSGSDALVLRVARSGGRATALTFPALDSTVWRSTSALPPLDAVLGFDPDDGYLLAVDTAGRAVRLDLRLGTVTVASAGAVLNVTADGSTVFAVDRAGMLARFTPVGDTWRITPTGDSSTAPVGVLPLRDGSVLVATTAPRGIIMRRFRPPDSLPFDSLTLVLSVNDASGAPAVLTARVGERAFVAAGEQLRSFRTRDLVEDLAVELGAPARAMVTSPSGDRVYVALQDKRRVRVVDRFEGRVTDDIALPVEPRALRMDVYGRVLLVRGDDEDVWVIDMGRLSVIGRVRSAWRADLPQVLPDGTIALAHDSQVVIVSSIDRGEVRTVPDGTDDVWFAFRWNGFRPRAPGIDQPVRFRDLEALEQARDRAAALQDSLAFTVPPDSSGITP